MLQIDLTNVCGGEYFHLLRCLTNCHSNNSATCEWTDDIFSFQISRYYQDVGSPYLFTNKLPGQLSA